VISRRPLLSSG